MDTLNTRSTHLGLNEDARFATGGDGAVQLRDMCRSVELVLVLGELVTDDKQQEKNLRENTNLLNGIARHSCASGSVGGGNALLRGC